MNELNDFEELTHFDQISDLYICAMGFEPRCVEGNRYLLNKNFKTKKTAVLRYVSYSKDNEKDIVELENIWNEFSDNFQYISYDSSDRKTLTRNFKELFSNSTINNVTINITTLSTFPLLSIVNCALDHAANVKIIYTEPEGYFDQLKNDHAFASGVKEIFTLPEFVGANLPGYSTLLIMFLGYDFIRTRSTYDQIQPSKKIGIFALPNTKKLSEYYQKLQETHKRSFDSSDNLYELSIFDLNGTLDKLKQIRIDHIETSNILISLNGSKLHTIAALLFAKKYNDIQIIVSTPSEYFPQSYSFGVGRTFYTEISKESFDKYQKPS